MALQWTVERYFAGGDWVAWRRRRPAGLRRLFPLAVGVMFFFSVGAHAVSLQWDANGVTPGSGGTGPWNTSTALWFNGVGFQAWSNAALDDAVFGGTVGTVTLAASITAHNLSFDITGYVVTGNTLTLGGASPAVSVVSGGTATIGSTVAGTAGLNKTGSGTLTLSGASTYTGATTVSSGMLQAGATNAFAQTSAFTIASGATLGLNNFNEVIGSLAGAGTVTNGGAAARTLTTGGDNTSTAFSGVIQNGGAGSTALIKAGTGTQTLTGDNTYTGTTTINAGAGNTLQLGNGGTTGSIAGLSIVDNGALVFNRSNVLAYGGVISGTGTLAQEGSGTTILTGANTFTGATTISAGTLQVGNGGGTGSIAGLSIVDNSALVFNRSGVGATYAGVISGTGSLTQAGTNVLTLTGANTFTGGTTISAGALQIGAGATGGIAGNIVDNGALIFNRTGTVTYDGAITGTGTVTKAGTGTVTLTGDSTYLGGTTISAGTLQLGSGGTSGSITGNVLDNGVLMINRSDALTFGSTISGTGAVTKVGVGTFTLTGDNTYTGTTTVSGGALQLGTGGTTGSIAGLSIVNNGALVIDRGNALTYGGVISGVGNVTQAGAGTTILIGANTFTGATTIGAGTLQIGNGGITGSIAGLSIVDNSALVFNRSNAQTYAGAISGTGTLTQAGANVLTLTGANTFTGGTTISSGTLQIGGSGATGSIASNIANNSALIFNRTGTLIYAGDVSGSGTVTKTGAGTLTLMGDNTYTGNTTISTTGSRLKGGAENAFSATSAHTLGTGVFLDLGGFDQAIGSLAGAGRVTNVGAGAATLTTGGNDTSTSYSGIIQNEVGVTGLAKVGAGTLTLSGVNTYTGATTVSSGMLQAGATNAFAQTSAFTIASGATLGLNNFNEVIGSLAGAGTVTNGGAAARTLTTGGDNTSTAFSGVIQNGGAGSTTLTKVGGGTFTLSGANTYTGVTALNLGTLQGGAANAFSAASAYTVAAGAILDLGGFNQAVTSLAGAGTVTNAGGAAATLTTGGATTFSGVIQDGSELTGLTKVGAGIFVLSGANTFTGGTTISSGTLQIGGGGATGSIASNIANNSALIFNRTGTLIYAGDVSGSGTVTKTGTGTLTLMGDNTYTGNTTISTTGSRLKGGAENAFSATSAHTLGTGVFLDLGGFDQAIGSLAGTGGTVTNAGATAATLTTGGEGSSTVFAGLILDGAGLTSLVKAGAGSFTLTGNSTFTGGTTINSGTLQLGNASTAGSVLGDIVNNGALVFSRSNAQTYSGVVSGIGTLTKTGTNILTLSGDSTYAGTTMINSGTLRLGSGGTSGSIQGNVIDNGILSFNRSDSLIYGGVISGGGSLAQIGSGTTILTGENTYTGGTTISAGALQIGNGGTTGSVAGAMINNGVFIFDRSDALTYAGAISGTGSLIKNGAGTLTLTGINPYSGGTTVNEGKLLLNNAVVPAPLVASPSGFVGGIGSIGPSTIGGILSPGNSIGTISVLGDLTFVPGSTFLVEVSPTAADRTDVMGIVNLSGLVEVLGEPGTYVPDTLYTIVAAAGVNGVFDGLVSNFASSAFLTPSLLYDASNACFALAITASFASVGQTPNEIATGGAVERLGFGNPIYDTVLMVTAAQAREAFDSLSGEVHASVSGVLASDSHYVRDALLGRMIEASYTSDPNHKVALAGSGTTAVAARATDGRMALGPGSADDAGPADPNPLTFWTRGFGSWGEFDGNGNAATARRSLGGFVSGMDTEVGDGWRTGLATGYTQSNINVGARTSSADVDSYILAAYAGGTVGPLALRSGAAWTWNAIASSRSVIFPGFYELERASYDAATGQLFAEAAFPMLTARGALEPFAGLAWVHIVNDGFTEGGSIAALTSSDSNENVGFSTLGIRAATTPQPAWGVAVTPRGSLSWQHTFGDLTPARAFAFASDGIPFGISGVPPAQDSALIDAGFDFALSADAFLSVSYVGQLATDLHDNGVQGRLDWRF